MNNYIPNPADTSNVTLSPQLLELCEKIAKNTHDVWAKNKQKQGYVYGPVTDNDARTHCDLIDYNELSEEKKDLDRGTSLETLKLLIHWGWKLIPPEK